MLPTRRLASLGPGPLCADLFCSLSAANKARPRRYARVSARLRDKVPDEADDSICYKKGARIAVRILALACESGWRYPARTAAILAIALLSEAAAAGPRHAIAMHGEPAYGRDFSHFRYANPEAPKGGRLTQGFAGTFDSINPFVIRGNPFQQVRGYVIESLMVRSQDEPFSLYGLIASMIETDEARTFSSSPSTRARASPTADRSRPTTCCSPGVCCARKGDPITGSTTGRSSRPRKSRPIASVSISGMRATANCR